MRLSKAEVQNRTPPLECVAPPPRLHRQPWWHYAVFWVGVAFLVSAFDGVGLTHLSRDDLNRIPERMLYIATNMFPPSLERLGAVLDAIAQTFAMAWVANVIGLPLSLIVAVLAARNLSPHPVIYYAVRGALTFVRTVPALVWAIFLIVAVGLGPRAGTVTLVMTTLGFCGRFFAEAMEEIDPGPQEALTALGATQTGQMLSAVFPAALPAFINTALFNLEQTTRSSTVLGIVGAGGIGVELMVSLKTFRYDEATTIIVLVFIMVMGIEQGCTALRQRLE